MSAGIAFVLFGIYILFIIIYNVGKRSNQDAGEAQELEHSNNLKNACIKFDEQMEQAIERTHRDIELNDRIRRMQRLKRRNESYNFEKTSYAKLQECVTPKDLSGLQFEDVFQTIGKDLGKVNKAIDFTIEDIAATYNINADLAKKIAIELKSWSMAYTGGDRDSYFILQGSINRNMRYRQECLERKRYYNEHKEEIIKKEREEREQREKTEIAERIKEKYRRRQLEKIVRQELIDSGELFGEQPKRPPIPREIVDAVYKRDGGRCVYCGSTQNLQLDHIIPFSKGGATTLENMQLLCQKCNIEKSNKIG